MIGNIPMPSQSNISQDQFHEHFSKIYSNKNMFDVTVPGFAYLKKHGIETMNVPDGIPLDLKGFRRITDLYGPRFHPVHKKWLNHSGIDFSGNVGTDIYSTGNGVISHVGFKRGYGKTIIVDHGKGVETLYAHLDSYDVKKGDKVLKGNVIGKLGNSGVSTGAHLHYELRLLEQSTDPMALMVGDETTLAKSEFEHLIKTQYNDEIAKQCTSYLASADELTRSEKEES